MEIIWGIFIAATGILMVVFHEKIYNFTGPIGSIEDRFPGNSRNFIKIIGILMVLSGVILFSGASGFILNPLGDFIRGLFGIERNPS